MSSEDILQQLKQSYLLGIPNHLEEMESFILSMEKGENYQENFEALYRKAHSLKGGGGTYGFSIVTSICHQMEDYISNSLQNRDNINQQVIDVIFKYIDIIKDTQLLLVDGIDNFENIEQRLKSLKGKVISEAIHGIYVGPANNFLNLCLQVLSDANAHCTVIESGVNALQRTIHEHFDFIITSGENFDLNGQALIAAIKLNQDGGKKIKTILVTSNQLTDTGSETIPDYFILKNKSFDINLTNAMKEIIQVRDAELIKVPILRRIFVCIFVTTQRIHLLPQNRSYCALKKYAE